jgi:hypothetical protein
MPRRFTNDLEIAQDRVNGFVISLKIVKPIGLNEPPNFGNGKSSMSFSTLCEPDANGVCVPTNLPPWRTVDGYFWRWERKGVWEHIKDRLARGCVPKPDAKQNRVLHSTDVTLILRAVALA